MFDENVYNVITESLQNDIDLGMISYEYANIINDLSYSVYVENVETNENMLGILDKYIDRIMSYRLFESVVDVIQNITEAFNDGEITEAEQDALLEAVQDKFYESEYYTESKTTNKKASEHKISTAVDNWKRKLKDKVSKIAKGSTPLNKGEIAAIGMALIAAIGGVGGLGAEVYKAEKQIQNAQKRAEQMLATSVSHTGDVEVHDVYHRLDGISDELKENLYELVKAGPADDVDTFHVDNGLDLQFHAQNKNGKKILKVESRSSHPKSGPVDIRREEKETADYNKKIGLTGDKAATLETKILRQKVKYSTTSLKKAYDDAIDKMYDALNKADEASTQLGDRIANAGHTSKNSNTSVNYQQESIDAARKRKTENSDKMKAYSKAADEIKGVLKKAEELERKQNITVDEYDDVINKMVDKLHWVNKDLTAKT